MALLSLSFTSGPNMSRFANATKGALAHCSSTTFFYLDLMFCCSIPLAYAWRHLNELKVLCDAVRQTNTHRPQTEASLPAKSTGDRSCLVQ